MATTTSVDNLYATLGLPSAPLLLDVRSEKDFLAEPKLIPGARRVDMTQPDTWRQSLPSTRSIVAYCAHGGELSRDAAERLAASGCQAMYLNGGFESWMKDKRATVRARDDLHTPGRSRWVTRERPKIDRLACPWLVRRFIDPDALFFYTPAHQVRADAETLEAEPYDIADVTF
ncbi:MAG TPA: chromate resistance protein ChrB domain-containing protein, partial [Steroidobacteraceae bacterium]|nr:chromate resistance protein ChrB domain-containing protein [Steroidobacteraceae bacterium]